MQTIEIIGKNFRGAAAHTREACRAIVLRQGKLLLSHERNTGWWLLPGGGVEDGETIAECCAREVLEETGYFVTPAEHFLTLREYYDDWCYVSHYFFCHVTGQGDARLTSLEESRGLVPEWLAFEEACAIFAAHGSYAAVSEEQRGSYQREDTALRCFRSAGICAMLPSAGTLINTQNQEDASKFQAQGVNV